MNPKHVKKKCQGEKEWGKEQVRGKFLQQYSCADCINNYGQM
jgi:hypothetical protein